jgi:serine protease
VAALVRAANKSLTPAQVRALLKSTATPLSPNDQNQMGAGLVNAEAAVAGSAKFIPMQQVAN